MEELLSRLRVTGVARLSGVVDRGESDQMADAVWASLAVRGIDKHDRRSWPSGFVGKHQQLRTSRVFDAFATARLDAVADELLGPGTWDGGGGWGPALVTFPEPGPWTVPHKIWHFDLPGRGDPQRLQTLRLFGFVTDVGPRGGGTLVVEGSHTLVQRLVAAAPAHDAGGSNDLRRQLAARHPWFRALETEGGDRVRQFMLDGEEIDGVRVRVAELTADAGDVTVMLPWTMHNLSQNCTMAPRFMVTHSLHRRPPLRRVRSGSREPRALYSVFKERSVHLPHSQLTGCDIFGSSA